MRKFTADYEVVVALAALLQAVTRTVRDGDEVAQAVAKARDVLERCNVRRIL